MSNKTVLAELIEYFEQQLRLHRSSEIKYTTEEALVDAIQVCQNGLKTKEKTQIQDAFDNGQANWDAKCQDYKDGKDYYSQVFKTN